MTDTTIAAPTITYDRYSREDLRVRGLFRDPTEDERKDYIGSHGYRRSHSMEVCVVCGAMVQRRHGSGNHGRAHERRGEAESWNVSIYGTRNVFLRNPNAEELAAWKAMTNAALERMERRHAIEFEMDEARASIVETARSLIATGSVVGHVPFTTGVDLANAVKRLVAAEAAMAAYQAEHEPEPETD